jgi:uncharacterized protein YkuJ
MYNMKLNDPCKVVSPSRSARSPTRKSNGEIGIARGDLSVTILACRVTIFTYDKIQRQNRNSARRFERDDFSVSRDDFSVSRNDFHLRQNPTAKSDSARRFERDDFSVSRDDFSVSRDDFSVSYETNSLPKEVFPSKTKLLNHWLRFRSI